MHNYYMEYKNNEGEEPVRIVFGPIPEILVVTFRKFKRAILDTLEEGSLFIPCGVGLVGNDWAELLDIGITEDPITCNVDADELADRFKAMAPYWEGAFFQDEETPVEFMEVQNTDAGICSIPFTVEPKWLCQHFNKRNMMEVSTFMCSSDDWSTHEVFEAAKNDTASGIEIGESSSFDFKTRQENAEKKILSVDVSRWDFDLLRFQKMQLLNVIGNFRNKHPDIADNLDGIVAILDDIEDAAEEQRLTSYSCESDCGEKRCSTPSMNTRIEYLYRDASNYKVYNSCVVSGEITEKMENKIKKCLDCGEYFIPSIVGLPEEKFSEETEDDVPYFEWIGISATNNKPNVDMSAEELVEAFKANGNNWEV